MIESIEVLQTNRYRYCVVSKMRYLGEDYNLNAAYNGHGKIFLQDERLRNIEPIRYVHRSRVWRITSVSRSKSSTTTHMNQVLVKLGAHVTTSSGNYSTADSQSAAGFGA